MFATNSPFPADPSASTKREPTFRRPAFRANRPPSALKPAVFLPGLLCDHSIWRSQLTELADVVAAVVPDLSADDSIEQMAERVLAGAPSRFALVGLSMGGYVALEIMRRAPERVTRLALLDTSARPDTPERAARRRAGIESLGHGRFKGVTTTTLRKLIHQDHQCGAVGDELRAMATRVGAAVFRRQQLAILQRPDCRDALGKINVRTLVGVGEADVITPLAEAEELCRQIPRAALHVFRHCGHLPAIESPDETSTVLRRWLSDFDA